jgi:hypothetical protein
MDSLRQALREADKNPPVGVTQGGSSREFPGCVSAATRGVKRQRAATKKQELDNG